MRSKRHYERQIDKLLTIISDQNDRLMYLAGRTWEPPPAPEPVELEPDLVAERFVWAPEQSPDADY